MRAEASKPAELTVSRLAPPRRFEKMHPVPKWASDARRKVLKRRAREAKGDSLVDDSDDENASDDDDELDDLFRTTKSSRKKATKRGALPSGEIEIDRVRDANQAEATSVSGTGAVFSVSVGDAVLISPPLFIRAVSSLLASIRARKSCSQQRRIDDYGFSR